MHGNAQDIALSRRNFMRGASAAAFTITAGAIINPLEAWGLEVKVLKPTTMRTLIQMARDIYPHDRIADRFYAVAVKFYDAKAGEDPALKAQIEDGVAMLDGLAKGQQAGSYVDVGWEADRTKILQKIEFSPFFQMIRSGLVVGLYNQKDVWALFGYEGESASKGGYVTRGFDDIAWL